MFDSPNFSTEALELHESLESPSAPELSDDQSVALGAFDDVLNDPAIAKVAPAALVERKVSIATPPAPRARPRVAAAERGYMPSAREQVYVEAMGPRPGRGGLGLDQKTETNLAGLSLLVVGLGGAFGAAGWGWRGGAAGSLAGGAVMNAYRASKASGSGESKEAVASLTYALVGAGAAAWLMFAQRKASRKEQAEE